LLAINAPTNRIPNSGNKMPPPEDAADEPAAASSTSVITGSVKVPANEAEAKVTATKVASNSHLSAPKK
jgi:hypothetical protein